MGITWVILLALVCWASFAFRLSAEVNESEVQALRGLYTSLDTPEQLHGWKLDGGNPCTDSWLGVECFESTIIHLNLSGNRFTLSIPYSIGQMKHLTHLNISHNALSGTLGNVFSNLKYLREMDLSFNNFSGDLPNSFRALTNLTRLFLQENQFTGSVNFLANLNLSDLNIKDNKFSGMIPEKLQDARSQHKKMGLVVIVLCGGIFLLVAALVAYRGLM